MSPGPILVGRIFNPRRSPVRATGGSLPRGGYLLVPLTGNKEGGKGFMVLRVGRTATFCGARKMCAVNCFTSRASSITYITLKLITQGMINGKMKNKEYFAMSISRV